MVGGVEVHERSCVFRNWHGLFEKLDADIFDPSEIKMEISLARFANRVV